MHVYREHILYITYVTSSCTYVTSPYSRTSSRTGERTLTDAIDEGRLRLDLDAEEEAMLQGADHDEGRDVARGGGCCGAGGGAGIEFETIARNVFQIVDGDPLSARVRSVLCV